MAAIPLTDLVRGQKYIVRRADAEDKPVMEGIFTGTSPIEGSTVMVNFSNVILLAGPIRRSYPVYGFVFNPAAPAFAFVAAPTGGRRKSRRRSTRRRRQTRSRRRA